MVASPRALTRRRERDLYCGPARGPAAIRHGTFELHEDPVSAQIDVRLDRITKRFHEVVAVDDLSLDIERGEFFSMLGPPAAARPPRCA